MLTFNVRNKSYNSTTVAHDVLTNDKELRSLFPPSSGMATPLVVPPPPPGGPQPAQKTSEVIGTFRPVKVRAFQSCHSAGALS